MTADEWRHRAEREAAAILSECGTPLPSDYPLVVSLMAAAWMQGTIFGSHFTLAELERGFDKVRAEL